MPSQFQNQGDRLVFSNGVVVLTLLAGGLIWAFDAELTRLIQLYVVGVFTAFTLSQAGMVRRWITRKEERWKRGAIINGVGATTTGVVLVIVTITKFAGGAWIVIVAMPIIVSFFLTVRRHYDAISAELRRGRVTVGAVGTNHAILLVPDVDAATAEALGYVRSIRPHDLHALYPSSNGVPPNLDERWRRLTSGGPELMALPMKDGDLLSAVRGHLRTIPCRRRDFITVVVPEIVSEGLAAHVLRSRSLFRLKAGLLREPNVVIADVPVQVHAGIPVGVDARPLIPERTVALVFVSAVHDATVRAVNYAVSLGAADARAVYFALDPLEAPRIQEEWAERGLRIPLDIVEAPFRDLGGPILEEVRRITARRDTVCAVVLPEFVLSKWRHMLLHNQNALFMKRLLLFEPRVVLSSVPFGLGQRWK